MVKPEPPFAHVVVATAISGPLDLPDKYHIDIVGKIPLG